MVSRELWIFLLEFSNVDSMVNAAGAPMADQEAWSEPTKEGSVERRGR
jgi:hypothetical protein